MAAGISAWTYFCSVSSTFFCHFNKQSWSFVEGMTRNLKDFAEIWHSRPVSWACRSCFKAGVPSIVMFVNLMGLWHTSLDKLCSNVWLTVPSFIKINKIWRFWCESTLYSMFQLHWMVTTLAVGVHGLAKWSLLHLSRKAKISTSPVLSCLFCPQCQTRIELGRLVREQGFLSFL